MCGLGAGLHVALPVRVGLGVADVLEGLDVDLTPDVQRQRPHLGDVRPEVAVDARALDAHEDAEVDRGPVGVARAAVRAHAVTRDLVLDVVEVEDLALAQGGQDLALDGLLPVLHLLLGAHLELPLAAVQGHQQQLVDDVVAVAVVAAAVGARQSLSLVESLLVSALWLGLARRARGCEGVRVRGRLDAELQCQVLLVTFITGARTLAGRFQTRRLFTGYFYRDVAQLNLLALHVVDVGLEGGVVGHHAVAAEADVLAPVQTRHRLLVHVALLQRDQAAAARDLAQLLLGDVGLVQGLDAARHARGDRALGQRGEVAGAPPPDAVGPRLDPRRELLPVQLLRHHLGVLLVLVVLLVVVGLGVGQRHVGVWVEAEGGGAGGVAARLERELAHDHRGERQLLAPPAAVVVERRGRHALLLRPLPAVAAVDLGGGGGGRGGGGRVVAVVIQPFQTAGVRERHHPGVVLRDGQKRS